MTACGSADRVSRAPDAIVDDAGREVRLDAPARRIVSLSPVTTELLFAIGAGDRVVGRTTWDSVPPEATAVPSVGDAFPPNLEVILGRHPDLVVLYQFAGSEATVARLDDLGIPSLSVRTDALRSVPRAARLLGRATGTSRRADALAADFERRLARAEERIDTAGAPRGVIVTWDNPPIVLGRSSFLSEYLLLAGARNIFGHVPDASLTVTIETIAAADPDFILLPGGLVPDWTSRPEWQSVRAVREHRFVSLDGSEFSWPSFRAFDAVERLRTAIAAVVGDIR